MSPNQKKKSEKWKHYLRGVFFLEGFNFHFPEIPKECRMDSFRNLLGGTTFRRVTNLSSYKDIILPISIKLLYLQFVLVFLEPYMKDWSTSFTFSLQKKKKKRGFPSDLSHGILYLSFNDYRLTITKDIVVPLSFRHKLNYYYFLFSPKFWKFNKPIAKVKILKFKLTIWQSIAEMVKVYYGSQTFLKKIIYAKILNKLQNFGGGGGGGGGTKGCWCKIFFFFF